MSLVAVQAARARLFDASTLIADADIVLLTPDLRVAHTLTRGVGLP